jgi:thioredoxin 1
VTEKPRSVTDESFERDVLGNKKTVVVDFWAEWCGPCHLLAPELDQLADEYDDKIEIVRLNIEDNPGVTGRYKITSVPTLHVYRSGEVVKTIVGAEPNEALVRDLEEYLR